MLVNPTMYFRFNFLHICAVSVPAHSIKVNQLDMKLHIQLSSFRFQ